MNRRQSLAQIIGLAAASGLSGCRTAPAAGAVDDRLDLVSPAGQLDAFLKIFVSRRPETIWYWYTGTLDAVMPGRPVVPLLACDTLIRREVLPLPGRTFAVRTFESNFFRLRDRPEPLAWFDNPLNGRRVEPLHYREGPHFLVLSEQAPRFVAGADPARVLETAGERSSAAPFALRWQRIGSMLLATRETYSDGPHPLDPGLWRLESAGPRQSGGSFANYFADAAEVASPERDRVDCSFAYQAIFGWWPWLLMGQTPGHLAWRAQGRKLPTLADVPPASRTGFEQLHPRMFAEGLPWTEPTSMWKDYLRLRKPAG